jgi:hypothetical protein
MPAAQRCGPYIRPGNDLTFRFSLIVETIAYTGRVLSDAKPADLPLQSTKFEFVTNIKTARANERRLREGFSPHTSRKPNITEVAG